MAFDWAYLRGTKGISGFGSRSTAEDVTQALDLSPLTVIITGSTSGIGLETARVLAKQGARLIIPARNKEDAQQAKDLILHLSPSARVEIGELDLSSFASIHEFVATFKSWKLPLNILINNAGIVCRGFQLSENDFELQFATNHLGHFLLTKLLLDEMIATSERTGIEGRIVNVSSKHHAVLGDSLQFESLEKRALDRRPTLYAVSKLANILHIKELSRQLQKVGANITANALHPGIVHTQIGRNLHPVVQSYLGACSLFMRPIPQGAATTCYVATHPQLSGVSGKYFADCNEATCSSLANNMALATELWNFSEACIEKAIKP